MAEKDLSEEQLESSFHFSEERDEILSEDLKVGRQLLEREPPRGYIQEWSKVISKAKEEKDISNYTSVLMFRVGTEWLAVPIGVIREITEDHQVHTVPHKSDRTFKGIVNIRGELQLCISLRHLVGLKGDDDYQHERAASGTGRVYKRMIVIKQGLSCWVFGVDEIYGIHHYFSQEVQNAPVTVEKDANTFTKEVIRWKGKHVACLDADLMFFALKRKFQ